MVTKYEQKTTIATKFKTLTYKKMTLGLTTTLSTYEHGVDHIFASKFYIRVVLHGWLVLQLKLVSAP